MTLRQLIDKDALVAEIEKMLQEEYPCDNPEQTTGYHCALYELQDFLSTLEVKEVDLEKELNDLIEQQKALIRYNLELKCRKENRWLSNL